MSNILKKILFSLLGYLDWFAIILLIIFGIAIILNINFNPNPETFSPEIVQSVAYAYKMDCVIGIVFIIFALSIKISIFVPLKKIMWPIVFIIIPYYFMQIPLQQNTTINKTVTEAVK